MTAARHNLIIDQGATFSQDIIVKDKTGLASAVRDLSASGWSARASMRPTLESTTVYSFDVTIPSATAAQGLVKMVLPFANIEDSNVPPNITQVGTTSIPAGNYVYDLELVDARDSSNVLVSRLIFGTATVRREVTR